MGTSLEHPRLPPHWEALPSAPFCSWGKLDLCSASPTNLCTSACLLNPSSEHEWAPSVRWPSGKQSRQELSRQPWAPSPRPRPFSSTHPVLPPDRALGSRRSALDSFPFSALTHQPPIAEVCLPNQGFSVALKLPFPQLPSHCLIVSLCVAFFFVCLRFNFHLGYGLKLVSVWSST